MQQKTAAKNLPQSVIFYRFLIYGLHDLMEKAKGVRADLALYGHTHRPSQETRDGVLLVNPGSTSLPKGGNPPTFGFYADGRFSIHELESGKELAAKEL